MSPEYDEVWKPRTILVVKGATLLKAKDVLPDDKILVSKRKILTKDIAGVAHWKESWTVIDINVDDEARDVTISVGQDESYDVFNFPQNELLEVVRKHDTGND